VEGDVGEEMSAEEKPVGEEGRPLKSFLVRCRIMHAMGKPEDEFMDTVPAVDEEDAKDYVTGWLAERDFIVKRWVAVADLERLGRIARNLSK